MIESVNLEQGDLLKGMEIPIFYDLERSAVEVADHDLVVLTQSCDLVHGKIDHVLLASAWTVDRYREWSKSKLKDSDLRNIAKRRVFGLFLLHSDSDSVETDQLLIADFRNLHTLPLKQVLSFVENCGVRPRLRSPYREALSQEFGLLFMRVALPDEILRQ